MNDDSTTMIIDDPEAPAPLPPAPDAAPDPSSPAEQPELAPYMLAVIDIDWPEGNEKPGFAIDLPQPAVFQRLVRAEVPSPILGGRRKLMLRSIWLVKADGPVARSAFVVQQADQVMGVRADGTGARLLSTAVDQFGNPVAVWQRTGWQLLPPEQEAPVLHTV